MRQFIRLSADAQAVAADLARRGVREILAGQTPLPANLRPEVVAEINANLGWFKLAHHMAKLQQR